ncbi:hypothetical protein TNCV_2382551 [Trichonephila clavipes]|nr:hypothetical protein TNCV_2382551 [Trichonephila clavipes]
MYRHLHPVVHNYNHALALSWDSSEMSPEEQRMRLVRGGMDLRSASRVLRPRQFQEIKEVMKSSHLLRKGDQKTRSGRQIVHQTFRRFVRYFHA